MNSLYMRAHLLSKHPNQATDSIVLKEQILQVVRTHFSPEFTNRIDELVIFNRLSQANITDIVGVRFQEVEKPLGGPQDPPRCQQILNPLACLLIDGSVRHGEVAHIDVNTQGDIEIKRNLEMESDYKVEEPQSDEDVDMDEDLD
ncbi:hypothetical protein BC940DRAFT_335059 [Gongronella butleri]|nr:hypothetical protein BC940DRAFT_335059 [Gongronella butleri]